LRYDVIVVGAGPAGSTTALECAGRGLSVLLLDRAEFPRAKPCGGAVTKGAYDLLPVDISPVVERVIFGLDLTVRQSIRVSRRSPVVITYLTQRRRLDAFLVERAVEAGATLRERALLRQVERHPSHVTVRTSDGVFEGRALVAADGANGSTALLAGMDVGLLKGIALEGNVSTNGPFPERWESAMGMDFGDAPGGYGWIFPKGDHLNFGVAGWKYLGPSLRARLDRLVRFYGFDPDDLRSLRGHHLPIRQPSSPLTNGNVLLVGDAAGLLDPFTGEGIRAAIWSGQAAARHLEEYVGGEVEDLSGYRSDVERELVPDLRISRQFQDLFQLTPAMYMRVERATAVLWGLVCRILRGEQTYAGVMQNHTTLATIVEFVSDLVRVTPYLQRAAGLREPAPPQRFFLGSSHQGS
jgi:geranylgeranyl reductase family protein